MDNAPFLEVKHASKYYSAKTQAFSLEKRKVKAVDDISFTVYPGEAVGIVGESGCGKTTLGKLILHLLDGSAGEVLLDGRDVLKCKGAKMRRLRRDMQIVYQDPYTSLNPRMRIGGIIGEPLLVQKICPRSEVKPRVLEMLKVVGLSESYYARYPHECSGGQRQRVGIARALISKPRLIICDEAVSALDVSTQSQIINLLQDIQEEFKLTYLFISHGLSVVRHICNRVIVMYLGQIVEFADCDELYETPRHPYTQALFSAIPVPDPERNRERVILEGDIPNPLDVIEGCPFQTRCRYCMDICKKQRPECRDIGNQHYIACHLVGKKAE